MALEFLRARWNCPLQSEKLIGAGLPPVGCVEEAVGTGRVAAGACFWLDLVQPAINSNITVPTTVAVRLARRGIDRGRLRAARRGIDCTRMRLGDAS